MLMNVLFVDLHHPRVQRRMKKNEFQDHLKAMLPCLPQEYIEGVYDRIKASELKIHSETEETAASKPEGKKGRMGFSLFRFF